VADLAPEAEANFCDATQRSSLDLGHSRFATLPDCRSFPLDGKAENVLLPFVQRGLGREFLWGIGFNVSLGPTFRILRQVGIQRS
jgi:hypothetical protein